MSNNPYLHIVVQPGQQYAFHKCISSGTANGPLCGRPRSPVVYQCMYQESFEPHNFQIDPSSLPEKRGTDAMTK